MKRYIQKYPGFISKKKSNDLLHHSSPYLRSCLELNRVLFRDEAPDQADEIPFFKTALDHIRISPNGISMFLVIR